MSSNQLFYKNKNCSITVSEGFLSKLRCSEDEIISAIQYLIDSNLIIAKCTLFMEEYAQEHSEIIEYEGYDSTWEYMLNLKSMDGNLIYYGKSSAFMLYSLLKFVDREKV